MDKSLSLLGIAKKGGNVIAGEEQVAAACQREKVRLLLLSEDASENARHRAENWSQSGRIPLAAVPFTKEELGNAIGKDIAVFIGITERKLAAAFLKTLPEEYRKEEWMARLEHRPGRNRTGEKKLEVSQ